MRITKVSPVTVIVILDFRKLAEPLTVDPANCGGSLPLLQKTHTMHYAYTGVQVCRYESTVIELDT